MRWLMNGFHSTAIVSWLSLSVLLISAVGCTPKASDFPLDSQAAEESLSAFLETWKSGGAQSELETRRPGLVVGDYDWESGAKLTSFSILHPGYSDGTNWHIEVELELVSADGKTKKSKIPYVVGTKPVETIFRK